MNTLAQPYSELKNDCIVVAPPRVKNIANPVERAQMSPEERRVAIKNGPRLCRPQPKYVSLTHRFEPVFGVFAILLRYARVARSSLGDDDVNIRHRVSRAAAGEAK